MTTTQDAKYLPKYICFVEEPVIPEKWIIISQIKQHTWLSKLSILEPEFNNNTEELVPSSQTIYVVNKFENNSLLSKVDLTKNWILGPPALLDLASNVTLKLRSKPTFCHFLTGNCFYINCRGEVKNRMINLIKWMSGTFTREANRDTTFMITTSTLSSGYHYCFSFNVPIVSPEWINYCWTKRNTPGFIADSCMEDYKLPAFSGISMVFIGFNVCKENEYKRAAEENGAVIVKHTDIECTHMIISAEFTELISVKDIPSHIPFIVHFMWFELSLQNKHRYYEDMYEFIPVKREADKQYNVSRYQSPEDTTTKPTPSQESMPGYGLQNCNKATWLPPTATPSCSYTTPLLTPRDDKSTMHALASSTRPEVSGCQDLMKSSAKHTAAPQLPPCKRLTLQDLVKFSAAYTLPSSYKGVTHSATPYPFSSNTLQSSVCSSELAEKQCIEVNKLKRMMLVKEFYTGQQNHIKSLKDLINIQYLVSAGSYPILNEADCRSIFEGFEDIYKVHNKMLNYLKNYEKYENLGEAFMMVKDELQTVYIGFIRTVDERRKIIRRCEEKYLRFGKLLKRLHNIEHPKDSIGRIGLHLTRISFLFEEIINVTPKDDPTFTPLLKATGSLKEMLKLMNENKREMEQLQNPFTV